MSTTLSTTSPSQRAIALCLCLLVGGGIAWYVLGGTPSTKETSRAVVIRPQTGAFDIARTLKEAGVIRSRAAFLAVAVARGTQRRLLAGEYEFGPGLSLLEVIRRIEQGKGLVHQTTIPEGFAARQIAELLHEKGLIDQERFLALLQDRRLLRQYNVDGDSLEGYLFPDTYRLVKGMGEEAIIELMAHRFTEMFGSAEQARARELKMSVADIVTIASLIEREAMADEERPLISAVFHNRLRLGMPLQSDPTVLYGLSRFSGKLTKANLRAPSPYNTYLHRGLPPGPIASPGRASVMAALYPASSRYLYFVSKNDGTHVFSNTLREHDAMVRRYQIRRAG
ncbi:MAG: endolytic transglycosylase MltG [Candidatus Methylomirabilis oxygeniifera]|uniref:Endolytic murein transglycosylase n=1 Tax=Methylomirabilis oxygeniifera TaxID=671143 RepID=D5MH77_METO1|nr:MAG: endolytic transglycosylase MltG [Candidatus Methylomirabilis oxyfera]CBE69109.1 Aminodeoxychorismate lyase [Candidatus Methylomirabilis oxyfera]